MPTMLDTVRESFTLSHMATTPCTPGSDDMTTEQKETLIGWLGLALLILPFIIL
jgi:hypothetical protein